MTLMEIVQVTGCTFGTCSVDHPKNKCVTFVRNEKYLQGLVRRLVDLQIFTILIIVPEDMQVGELPLGACLYRTKYVDYEFTKYHNEWWVYSCPDTLRPAHCQIHDTAVIGEGIRIATGPNGVKLQLKHVGTVIFGKDVYVGPLTLIERGCIDSTIIGDYVKIDGRCCVGHNSVIGDNTIMATGATVGGSAKIGKDCWLGLDCTIRNNVSICDKVIVGMRTGVVKDITESGIYMGTPAKYHGPYVDGWNF
jgi:acetyltransferase-like isoleucine patch superfamily enzyme